MASGGQNLTSYQSNKLSNGRELYVDLSTTRDANSKILFNGTADKILQVSGTLPTSRGGTGNTSYTANRLLWTETATKFTAEYHYASSTKVGICYTSEPSYNFAVSGTSYFNGNTTHNGIDYFANGTTYYISNAGDSRLRNVIFNAATLYNQLAINISVSGNPWPCIDFSTRAGGTTYVTTAQNDWGQIYCQVPAKNGDTYYSTRFFFREFSKTANTTTYTNCYEDFYLPAATDGLTANKSYDILTTKATVTTGQGGTGNTSYTKSRLLYTNTATKFATGTIVCNGNTIEANSGNIWAGTDGNTTAERQMGVRSGAGMIYLFSHAATDGSRGIWLPTHGSGAARSVFVVDTNNNVTFYGSLSGNASSATQLQTSRSIWGQSFNGTGDVNGHLYMNAGNYLYMKYNNTNYGVICNYNNGCVVLCSCSAGMHIGYNYTPDMTLYYSSGTSRQARISINSTGAYANSYFGVRGLNTNYYFWVDGAAGMNYNFESRSGTNCRFISRTAGGLCSSCTGLMIRENMEKGGSADRNWHWSPRIGFLWGDLHNTQLGLDPNGEMVFRKGEEGNLGPVRALNFYTGSSRKIKKNIKKYDESALKLINKTQIYSFKFKGDDTNNLKVGFIADDADSIFSTKEHNSMDITNCVGMSFKAIQELYNEINSLRQQINQLTKNNLS